MSVAIKRELEALREASPDGILYPNAAVEWARDHPNSNLHAALQWDDGKAAHAYRLWQVRHLIRLHVVSIDGVPEMLSLTIDRGDRGGYRALDDVLADRELTEIMLDDALRELRRVQRRHAIVEELAGVWEAVDRVEQQAKRRKARRVTREDRPRA